MMRLRNLLSLVAVMTFVVSVAAPVRATEISNDLPGDTSDTSLVGEWSAPFSEGGLFDERSPQTKEEGKQLPAAVSMAVSPDGRIIYWNGVEGFEDPPVHSGWGTPQTYSRARILDLGRFLQGQEPRPIWTTPAQERGIGYDLFCSDLRNLADGRLLVVGGTNYTNEEEPLGLPDGGGRTEYRGTKETRIFDPETGTWTFGKEMNHARWYPSLITLADGKMLVAGGVEKVIYNDKVKYVNETETFDPSNPEEGWTDNGEAGATALPFYARLHLLPSGKVFYDASGQMWGPFGMSAEMAEWNKQKLYDPETKSWSEEGVAPLGGRSGTFSVMLPLKPPYDMARVLIAGGTFGAAMPGSYVGTPLTEIATITDDSVERELGPNLNNRRWHSSGVVLPSGEVIALSGGDRDDTVVEGVTNGVRQAEMFDGEQWIPLASSSRDRIYHHTAALLGDGSILVGGHAPLGFTPFVLPPDNYTHGAFAPTLRDPSFEIFKPPYLFRGERPRLTQVQSGVALGETFKITSPDASRITSVVLSRLPSVTHLADVDQRTIELEFTRSSEGTLQATVPENQAVALPGHYYLFLMTDNGQGPTPSKAAIVQIGETDHSKAPQPFGI